MHRDSGAQLILLSPKKSTRLSSQVKSTRGGSRTSGGGEGSWAEPRPSPPVGGRKKCRMHQSSSRVRRDYTKIRVTHKKRNGARVKYGNKQSILYSARQNRANIATHIRSFFLHSDIHTPPSLPVPLYHRINFVCEMGRNLLISTRPGRPWLPG